MFNRLLIAGGMLVSLAAPTFGKSVTSMLPAEPTKVTFVENDSSGCSETKMYLLGVTFQRARSDPAMMRLAIQARDAYAPSAPILEAGTSDSFFRALEIKNYAGLQRFLKLLGEPFDTDVMIVAIPLVKRFSSPSEQLDAWQELYISDVAEMGAERCAPSR